MSGRPCSDAAPDSQLEDTAAQPGIFENSLGGCRVYDIIVLTLIGKSMWSVYACWVVDWWVVD